MPDRCIHAAAEEEGLGQEEEEIGIGRARKTDCSARIQARGRSPCLPQPPSAWIDSWGADTCVTVHACMMTAVLTASAFYLFYFVGFFGIQGVCAAGTRDPARGSARCQREKVNEEGFSKEKEEVMPGVASRRRSSFGC